MKEYLKQGKGRLYPGAESVLSELKEERRIRLRIEKEIQDEIEEGTFIDADPDNNDDSLLKEDLVPDFDYINRNPAVNKVVERESEKSKKE